MCSGIKDAVLKKLRKIPYWYLIAIPLLLTLIGAASNQAVLIANGDKFPVLVNDEKLTSMCAPSDASNALAAAIAKALGNAKPSHVVPKPTVKLSAPDYNSCSNGGEFIDDTHTIMTGQSRLKPLADIFDMKQAIYSVGDFFLIASDWMWDWAVLAWLVLVIREFVEA
jgi:hypothetical protein